MDLELIGECLGQPGRQPDYRQRRSHTDFLTRLPLATGELSQALIRQWKCASQMKTWPEELTNQLVADKYSQSKWTKKV